MKIVIKVRRSTIVLTFVLLILSACQTRIPNSASAPTSPGTSRNSAETLPPTVNPDEAEILVGIQKTLADYNAGLEKNDKTRFMASIDPNNQLLWKFSYLNFDDLEASGYLKTIKLGMKVAEVNVLPQGLVLAKITRDRDGWIAHWHFRKVDDRWVLTEPTLKETGSPQTFENGGYTFKTYPIAKDVNEEYITLMKKARTHVQEDLGKVPESRVKISIFPSAAMSPYATGDLSGWYISPNPNGTDDIFILTPTNYFFGFYDPKIGWQPDIEMLLAHELARIAYVRNFGDPGQGIDWFFEGLAAYVAGYDQMPDIKEAVQNNTLTPILDESGKKVDLAHFTNLENRPLAYGLAESLVTFIVEKYGGLETFWVLANSYDKTQDIKKAIQETLGISYEEFDGAWRTWLQQDYIHRN